MELLRALWKSLCLAFTSNVQKLMLLSLEDVKLGGVVKVTNTVTNLTGLFWKNVKQKKHPSLQKDWSWWSRNLTPLAQTSRTCISKEALRWLGALCMAALSQEGEKWWSLLSSWIPRLMPIRITWTWIKEGAGIFQMAFFLSGMEMGR